MAFARIGGGAQVVRRHQVGEDVVAHDRGVLVGTGDAVEMPHPVPVVVSERQPQPCGLDEHRQAALRFQRIVARDNAIALERHGDVGVDVPRRSARRPVRRALLAADGAPRKGSPLRGRVRRLGRWRGPSVEARQRSASAAARGCGVRQHRKHETFGVPEGVAVVAGAGEPLARDRPALGASTGLQYVKQPEPHGLLAVGVALDLDVGAVPELVEVVALQVEQALPAGVARAGDAPRRPGRAAPGVTAGSTTRTPDT